MALNLWRSKRLKVGSFAFNFLLCASLFLTVSTTLAAKKGTEKKNTEEIKPGSKRRVVGSIIFPERGNTLRVSSAKPLLTPEVQAITEKALEYIRGSQQADGSWGDKQFAKSSGVTALCIMAFLAEGSLPRIGPSGRAIDKGIGFLMTCGGDDGLLVSRDTYKYGPLYDHTWSTFVLLQCYGNAPWYPGLNRKLSKAVQALIASQKPDGGWRYSISPLGRSDISVTVSAMLTLRLARMSGFAVPQERLERAFKFIKRCSVTKEGDFKGMFSYREGGDHHSSNPSATGAGMICYYCMGKYDDEILPFSGNYLFNKYNRERVEDLKDSPTFRYYYFGCYYTGQALYVSGDKYWVPWFKRYVASMKMEQAENGSVKDRYGNTVFPTAISAVILQAAKGYIPQFLR